MKISNKRVDEIIDELNSGTYQSQMADILEKLAKDDNLMAAVDQIFKESDNIEEIQCKIIMAIKEHATNITPEKLSPEELGMEERKIAKDIAKLTTDITDEKLNEQSQEPELQGNKLDKRDKFHNLQKKARENYKRMLKNFAIYNVYKVMNPRRIAGETKKDNYRHNMYIGGQKLASKHEGGRDHEVSGYNKKFIKNTKKIAKLFKKNNKQISM